MAVRGLSLIELLVAMAIGLVVTLAITRIMIGFDASKRTSTSVNDTVQSGSYTNQVLDQAIRSAGTGYTQRITELFGCTLNVRRASLGTTQLPPASAFPAPFANASLVRRLAPFLIEQGAADTAGEVRGDVLTVMSGAGGKSELPLPANSFQVLPAPGFALPFNGEYRTGDLVLLGGGGSGCMLQQVSAVAAGGALTLGGDYYSATGSTMNFADFGGLASVYAAQIGNVTLNNPPLFQLFGVGDGATLFSYDLLQSGTAAANQPQPIAENIVEMRALYGVDSDYDHTVNQWQNPGDAPFRYADLTAGTPAALNNLKQITAVRLGLILRSSLQEKEEVTPVDPTLFDGLTDGSGNSLQRVRTLSPADKHFRYRTVEMTIPLRNMQFAPLP